MFCFLSRTKLIWYGLLRTFNSCSLCDLKPKFVCYIITDIGKIIARKYSFSLRISLGYLKKSADSSFFCVVNQNLLRMKCYMMSKNHQNFNNWKLSSNFAPWRTNLNCSNSNMFSKKSVLKNFAWFTGNHQPESPSYSKRLPLY